MRGGGMRVHAGPCVAADGAAIARRARIGKALRYCFKCRDSLLSLFPAAEGEALPRGGPRIVARAGAGVYQAGGQGCQRR